MRTKFLAAVRLIDFIWGFLAFCFHAQLQIHSPLLPEPSLTTGAKTHLWLERKLERHRAWNAEFSCDGNGLLIEIALSSVRLLVTPLIAL
jgi:hypothetical protein